MGISNAVLRNRVALAPANLIVRLLITGEDTEVDKVTRWRKELTSCQNLRSETMTVLSRPALANSWSLPSLHSTDFTLLRQHFYLEKEPAASKPCVATKSSEGLVAILLEIPRS